MHTTLRYCSIIIIGLYSVDLSVQGRPQESISLGAKYFWCQYKYSVVGNK